MSVLSLLCCHIAAGFDVFVGLLSFVFVFTEIFDFCFFQAPLTLKLTVKRAKKFKKGTELSDESDGDAVESEGSALLSEDSDSEDSSVRMTSLFLVKNIYAKIF